MWKQNVLMAKNKLLTRVNLKKSHVQVGSFKIFQTVKKHYFHQRRHFRHGQCVQHLAKIDLFQNVIDGAVMELFNTKIALNQRLNVVSKPPNVSVTTGRT